MNPRTSNFKKMLWLVFVIVFTACSTVSPATPTTAPILTEPPTAVPVVATAVPVAATAVPVAATKESSASERIQVTFINPGISDPNDPTGTYWLSVSSFMQAAAESLGMDLEIIYSERDHLKMQQQARDVAARSDPPDYLVVVNEKQAADEMVKVADKAGIKVFVMLNTFAGDQATAMGAPREKYPNWIGSLIPDNKMAGYQIAKSLIDEAIKSGLTGKDGKIHLVAIAGDYATQASLERNAGLEKAISEYPNVKLEQYFVGEWNKDKTKEQTKAALERYPETSIIWAANDPMALGALDAVVEAGKKPGKDILIGGLNWDSPALQQIKAGGMVTSMGGHFMTGAWTLVLLYDYHHGKDFIVDGKADLRYTIFSVMNSQNVDSYLAEFGDKKWSKIDFTKFSKVLNPALTDYNFGLEGVFQNIKK
jgi:ABC-type sugar transport system substrate-binding protein